MKCLMYKYDPTAHVCFAMVTEALEEVHHLAVKIVVGLDGRRQPIDQNGC